jgi:hypothetical protein
MKPASAYLPPFSFQRISMPMINPFAIVKESIKKRLGWQYTNTRKIRGRIRLAVSERRFFLYLVSVHRAAIFKGLLPWLGVEPAFAVAAERGPVGWFTAFGTLVICILSSANAMGDIRSARRRFNRLLRCRDSKP